MKTDRQIEYLVNFSLDEVLEASFYNHGVILDRLKKIRCQYNCFSMFPED